MNEPFAQHMFSPTCGFTKGESPPPPPLGSLKKSPKVAGWTPLLHAAEQGHVEVARLLVEAGAEKDFVAE